MNSNWISTDSYCLYEPQFYAVRNLPPQYKGKQRSNNRYQTNQQINYGSQTKSNRQANRSVSNGRRFYSVGSNRSRKRKNHQIIRPQPEGWYQVDYVTRNQSLEPRLPIYEPVLTYNDSRPFRNRKKARNRHGSRHMYRWYDAGRFPSPTLVATTLGMMRQLPFSRLHYDSFKRIFPTMVTRAMKDRRKRLQAAKELPYAKYPDSQLKDIFLFSPSSNDTTVKDQTTTSTQKLGIEKTEPKTNQKKGSLNRDNITDTGDQETSDDESESSDDENKDEEDDDESIIGETMSEMVENKKFQYRNRAFCRKNGRIRNITPISEEFQSISETQNTSTEPLKPIHKFDEDILPFIDIEQTMKDDLREIPLAAYDETSPLGDSEQKPYAQNERSISTATTDSTLSESKTTSPTQIKSTADYLPIKPDLNKLPNKTSSAFEQKDVLSGQNPKAETELTVPPPQVAASLFESASAGQMHGSLLCNACLQSAYPAERFEISNHVFHIACFKCHSCGSMLHRGAWNQRDTHYYCNPCHRRIALQTLRH